MSAYPPKTTKRRAYIYAIACMCVCVQASYFSTRYVTFLLGSWLNYIERNRQLRAEGGGRKAPEGSAQERMVWGGQMLRLSEERWTNRPEHRNQVGKRNFMLSEVNPLGRSM